MTFLITGATGFIGARAVEMLHAQGRPVRAMVHRWHRAARLARLPVEMVQGSVRDIDSLDRAMAGVDVVLHFAFGDRSTTVAGTRNVLTAARGAGVSRVVNVSTVDVYGHAAGDVGPDAPLAPRNDYARDKADAEAVCRAAEGVEWVTMRPGVVYGPFSPYWAVRVARRLVGRHFASSPAMAGTCNAVYVDDVVSACLLAASAPAASGRAFNVVGTDVPTWEGFYHAFADAAGIDAKVGRSSVGTTGRALATWPLRVLAQRAMADAPGAVEAMTTRSRFMMQRALGVEAWLTETPDYGELALYRRRAVYTTRDTAHALGWQPAFDLQRGLERTVAWLRHARLLPAPTRAD